MAAMGAADSGSPSSSSGAEAERLPVPSKNPLPLSASQEAQVRELYYARVRRKCKDEIKGMLMLSPLDILPLLSYRLAPPYHEAVHTP